MWGCPVRVERELILVVLRVHEERGADLVQVASARGGGSLVLGLRDARDQDRGDERDEADHDEQLDQCECPPGPTLTRQIVLHESSGESLLSYHVLACGRTRISPCPFPPPPALRAARGEV